ncbi:MAG: two-component regulator propeller domain-containing protein, partial [Bacteroidota bacterium]
MKLLLTIFCLLAIGATAFAAPGFSVRISPRRKTIVGGDSITFTIRITPREGFTATVNLVLHPPDGLSTLPVLSREKLDAPYSARATFVVTTIPSNLGTYIFVVEGRNGGYKVYDTCSIRVISSAAALGWSNYTPDNSPMPDTTVNRIVMDRDGAGWIATNNGVARFDGFAWDIYTPADFGLSSNRVTAMAVDSSNALWIGNDSGQVARFSGGTWTPFTNVPYPIMFITDMAASPNGDIWLSGTRTDSWFAVPGMAARYRAGSGWTLYDSTNSEIRNWIGSLAIDRTGLVWFGLYHPSGWMHIPLVKFDGTFWTTHEAELFASSDHAGGYALTFDRQNQLWFSTLESVVVRHKDGTFITSDGRYGAFPGARPTFLTFDQSGGLWVADYPTGRSDNPAYDGGIARYDGTSWKQYVPDNSGLEDLYITGLAVDHQERIWTGSQGNGLTIFDQHIFDAGTETTAATSNHRLSEVIPNPAHATVSVAIT